VDVPDVRAGFSSVIAASIAEGPSVLMDVASLERGYDEPFERLQSIGMAISRIEVPDTGGDNGSPSTDAG
jgi:UDP-N-acetylglucosamine 1-carboxyvinyltransferase